MQLTNSPSELQLPRIEAAMNPQRLLRYMPAAGQDNAIAFKFYLWNCAISEVFYMPLHFAEIVCRNAVHSTMVFRLGEDWYNHNTFRKIIDPRFSSELDIAIADEREQHGEKITRDHIASALTFGFWEHMTTKRFQRLLWNRGISYNFPGAHYSKRLDDLHSLMEGVRRWRNRIAHHRAIFDKDPTRKYQEALELIKWVCPETAAWVTANSKVPAAIALRPQN